MHPRHLHISDYDYPLPPDRIARYPMAERDQSKLLVYRKGHISHRTFCDIPDLLPPDTLLIYNNTKVIQARLHFRKETGALIEIFCLEPYTPRDYEQNFRQIHSCEWLCLIGNKKKWHGGKLYLALNTQLTLSATLIAPHGDSYIVRFEWESNGQSSMVSGQSSMVSGQSSMVSGQSSMVNGQCVSFSSILEALGELPIPPYLNRATEDSDLKTYQTVYSKIDGSVAAPTAGLHFTDRVLRALDAKGIERDEVTLHVGAGTFRPVKSEDMGGHEMHSEHIYVTRRTIERLLAHGCRCTAVGTTSVRTIESLYYIGRKLMANPHLTEDQLHVTQWEPYEENREQKIENRTPSTYGFPLQGDERGSSLSAILSWLDLHHTDALRTTTQIIIAPGYRYHYVERIITNFHMPQSTLLLLVSAFVGDDWRRIYDYALAHNFRFLSYGDSSLLEP